MAAVNVIGLYDTLKTVRAPRVDLAAPRVPEQGIAALLRPNNSTIGAIRAAFNPGFN